jgi:GTP-binding protein
VFLDEAVIVVRSGSGGDGCVSFRREKYVPRGGPNGGDGGNGGSVYLRASKNVATLLDLGRRRRFAAENGRPGMGNNRTGRRGRECIVEVPVGTVVREVTPGGEHRQGRLLIDLMDDAQTILVARGGRGGRGNTAFATATHRVPRTREEGQPGEERQLYLELKLIADVGLVGLPNAGKSTLLSRLSAATPKVADYPFTTLKPHLGICELGDYRRLVLADLPGLIEGAHLGHGLGIEFLRHIERTSVLVHLLSCEAEAEIELPRNYGIIERELSTYSSVLAAKPRLIVLSKTDILSAEELSRAVARLEEALGAEVLPISAHSGQGLDRMLGRLVALVDAERDRHAVRPSTG